MLFTIHENKVVYTNVQQFPYTLAISEIMIFKFKLKNF